jgi:hypothetical protein
MAFLLGKMKSVNLMEKFTSKEGIILISIIWGLGLSCLFRKVCKDRSCIVYKAPDKDSLLGKIYKFGDDCYKYSMKVVNCPTAPLPNTMKFVPYSASY